MSAGSTAERVHDAVRARIMNREFRPGDRLDPAVLGGSLAASVTPVRDALHVLVGEGLVESRSTGGFHVPVLDEPTLEDFYDWSSELLLLALRAWPSGSPSASPEELAEPEAVAERVAVLFLTIANRSCNREHARAVERLNTRLHAARTVEPHVIEETQSELEELWHATINREIVPLRRLCRAYHRRRRRAAAGILRALYRID